MNDSLKLLEKTMSSMEIAELTEKRHDHVLRDIRELNRAYQNLHKPKIGLMFKIKELPNEAKRKDPYFELTKMQTLDLLTGYNTELRIKVNHRWAELEANEVLRMPRSIDVYGMEALPYDHWLLMNGYSVSSGQRNNRIRRYPQHFYRTAKGKWYISKLFANELLKIRKNNKALADLKPLPTIEQAMIAFSEWLLPESILNMRAVKYSSKRKQNGKNATKHKCSKTTEQVNS